MRPLLLLLSATLLAQSPTLFSPRLAESPNVKSALDSIASRHDALIAEWIHITEIPSPSKLEKDRIAYLTAEFKKLHADSVTVDDLGNITAIRKGTGGGPRVLIGAHSDTVFPLGTPVKVQRDGALLRAPGIGDDTGAVASLLETFRALDRAHIQTKGDLIFLIAVQEELGLLGVQYWMDHNPALRPDQYIEVDGTLGEVAYGALRINQLKITYSSKGAHTLVSRGLPNPARAVSRAILEIGKLDLPTQPGTGPYKLPVANVGTLGGGSVINAIPRDAWFTVDVRSTNSQQQDELLSKVNAIAEAAGKAEGVPIKIETPMPAIDYSKARSAAARRADPIVDTALDVLRYLKIEEHPEPIDFGSSDANIGVKFGIPSIGIGTVRARGWHTLEENADLESIVPGTQALLLLSVTMAGVAP